MEKGKEKEVEIEWYRKEIVPFYKEIVEVQIAREFIERQRKKGGADVPKSLRNRT